MGADFSGYVTKANLECTDGRTILPDAFKHMDGKKVPLVWKHIHDDPTKVLGHVMLEARNDGLYGRGYFNKKTKQGTLAQALVEHGDIDSMSIYANQLRERRTSRGGKAVEHGMVREVSLVLSGANPGATIDFVSVRHADGDLEDFDDVAIIHMGIPFEELEQSDDEDEDDTDDLGHADEGSDSEETVQDIYDTLNEKQKELFTFAIGAAVEEARTGDAAVSQSDESDEGNLDESNDEGDLAHQKEIEDMGTRNAFDTNAPADNSKYVITHEDVEGIFKAARANGSFKDEIHRFLDQKGLSHGIEDIELLFPDAKAITNKPEFDKRRTEWVSGVLGEVHKTPFTRIKSLIADLTQDEARAKGYIKGEYKKQEWIGITKRTTTPTTVYKKQELDRDDVLDITDFNVVDWLMGEMRLMLEEELARAILLGDGRDVSDEDKIKDPLGSSDGAGIRSILNDNEVYVTTLNVNVADANSNYEEVVDAVMDGMEFWKGTGRPTFYTTVRQLNKFKKAKDTTGRRYYENNAAVAEALGVDRIVLVEPMNDVAGLIGIIVNLADYNLGTDKGGEITSFEDFDIDYNKHKYLLETRLSGALIRVKAALVLRETTATLVVPTKPTFVPSTGVVTIPTVTGVVYKNADTDATISAGAMSALAAGASIRIKAIPASGSYAFADTVVDGPWTFKRPEA